MFEGTWRSQSRFQEIRHLEEPEPVPGYCKVAVCIVIYICLEALGGARAGSRILHFEGTWRSQSWSQEIAKLQFIL